jgi:hypothetical protein
MLLLAACLAIGAVTAQAQKIPLYSETFDERTDNLVAKEWRSAEGHLRQEQPKDDGSTLVTIYRADSMKFYTLSANTKIVAELPLSQRQTPGEMVGLVTDASSTKELTGRQTIEGYDCAGYRVKKYRTLASGETEESYHTEWYYEPLDLVIRYVESFNAINNITRNIRQGPQPANLFVIPADYKRFDTASAMEQMRGQIEAMKNLTQGKPVGGTAEQQQQQQDAMNRFDEIEQQSKQLDEDNKGKSEQEQIIEALKLMGGGKK